MTVSPATFLMVAVLASARVLTGEGDAVAPPELTLVVAGAPVVMSDEARARLVTELVAYFEACHPYSAVVVRGDQPSPEELARLWTERSERDHALLRATGAVDSLHQEVRGQGFDLLVGFDPGRGGVPVLTRGEDGSLTSYIKCPGLEGLLLGCLVEEMVSGKPPSSDCARWREIQRRVEPGSMTSPEKEN